MSYDTTKPYMQEIERLVKTTWDISHLSINGGCISMKDRRYRIDIYHVDGIGTKGIDHWRMRTFAAAVQDALAMNLNDFALLRALPFGICDHIFLPEDDHCALLEIVKSLAQQCRSRQIAITAGESAIHHNLNGLEISVTMFGMVTSIKPNHFYAGDVLIGIRSSGLHANGFTKLHEIYGDITRPEFTDPTLIYINHIQAIDRVCGINGMAHITGGAYTKIKRFLGRNDAVLLRNHTLTPHPIFRELYSRGVSDEEMYRTFNCGIGFVIGVNSSAVPQCLEILRQVFSADVIGVVKPGTGSVHIQSMFSDKEFTY